MSSNIRHEFVEERATELHPIPREWGLGAGPYYLLDLKMCQIKSLKYDFYWGDERLPEVGGRMQSRSIVDQPSRILKLNISLNDLSELPHDALMPLSQIRVLDASLNRIVRFVGVEVLTNLRVLNLSHNNIRQIEGLSHSHLLVELNLSMNQLEEVSLMPSLSNLTILHLNNNKLYSLDGIQALSHLKELYAQRNKLHDLLPLSSGFQLSSLNASYNLIDSLSTTVHVLTALQKLQTLSLMGNPIERENNYENSIIDSTTIISLDNTSLKPQYKYRIREAVSGHSLMTIKDAARQAFREQLHRKRRQVDENVRFLQQRIIDIQEDFHEYEEKAERDLEACLRFLDGLSSDAVETYDVEYFRQHLSSPQPSAWQTHERPRSPEEDKRNRPRGDYKGITDTDQVLRFVNHELAQEVQWNSK